MWNFCSSSSPPAFIAASLRIASSFGILQAPIGAGLHQCSDLLIQHLHRALQLWSIAISHQLQVLLPLGLEPFHLRLGGGCIVLLLGLLLLCGSEGIGVIGEGLEHRWEQL